MTILVSTHNIIINRVSMEKQTKVYQCFQTKNKTKRETHLELWFDTVHCAIRYLLPCHGSHDVNKLVCA